MKPTRSHTPDQPPAILGRSFAILRTTLACALLAAAASAQETTNPTTRPPGADDETIGLGEFVVSGLRGSLMTAQEFKQNAVPFIDSIAAQDIGKFPDNTVADALQRVPGIQVARDNGEVNSVVIRGLPNLGTTLNGHEIFTGTGRGVALQDIPAELVAGVDVYKTSTPDQIEGGIAGVIDIRLRRPFDFAGLELSAGGRVIEGKEADGTSWVASGLVSDRWKLPNGGEVGALVSVSGNRYHFKDQRVFNFLWEPVPIDPALAGGQSTVMLPVTAGSLLTPGDRRRTGTNVSLQWRPNQQLEFYADVLYTQYRNEHDVNFFIGFPRFGEFQEVTLVPGTNIVAREVTANNFHLNSTQAFDDKTDGYQTVVGAKWTRDNVKASTEAIYNWSRIKNRGVIVDVQYVEPSTFTFDLINGGGTNIDITGGDIRDENNYRLWGLFDNRSHAKSEQIAWKADVEYQLGSGLLTHLKGGVRVAERDATSRQSSRNDIAPAAGRGVVPTTSIQGFGSLAPDGLFDRGEFGASNWYAGDADFQRDNPEIIRQAFGLGTAAPDFNPTLAFSDTETTYAAYLQAGYKFDAGAFPVEGLIGARVINTQEKLEGYLASGEPISSDKDDWDVLPTLVGRVRLRPNLYLRYSAGRTITRPNFVDLNPVVTLFAPTTTGGALGTGSGGNPELKNVESTNYDLSLEYYFAKASYVSLAGFYREIDGYVQTFASIETIGDTDYIVTRPRNSDKGHLDGVEFTYQHFPEFLPSFLQGFGWQTNFTYIEGQNRAPDPTSTANPAPLVELPYAQVSKYSYNIVAIYERGRFSARLAYNWRDKYVDTFNGPNSPTSGLRTIRVKDTDWLNFSASFALRENLTITFDATNLLDQKFQDYFGDNADLYPRDTRHFDRTYEVGVRYRY
ncbi:MAG TPA: TonB-dependent receptor [Opitutaceae bacterium]